MSEEIKYQMSERTKTGLEILQTAILIGILGDTLLRATPWGLNVLLFIGALAAAMIMLVLRRKNAFLTKQNMFLHSALIFFGAMFVWRDSIELRVFDGLAIFTILAILTLPALKVKTQLAGVSHYIIGYIFSGINTAIAPFFLLFNDIKWKTIPQTGWSKHLIAVLRGVAIAAPLLLIFGALFVAADAVFQGIVERTFNIQPDVLIGHIFLAGFLSWTAAGYLRGITIEGFGYSEKNHSITPNENHAPIASVTEISEEPNIDQAQAKKKTQSWASFDNTVLPKAFTLGVIETSIVLGLINLLFLSFVIVQIPYLFGGFELVQNTPDFKLSEYARRGFGELVTVAALVLPILLVSHWLLRKDSPINEKIYRVLAGIQIALLFVIMISAAQRLLILTGNLGYGLTTVRFYPMICMIWLAVVFGWFALTVLRGAREKFAWGALWSALVVLGTLHFINPDDYIARTNIRLMTEGRAFDAYYNSRLSDDALPVLMENLSLMSVADQCTVKSNLTWRATKTGEENDFRTWNYSRSRAKNLMESNAEALNSIDCPNNYYRRGF